MKFLSSVFICLAMLASSASASKKIVVDLTKQEAFAYEDGRLQFSGWISTGRPGRRTPTGHFRVLEKDIDHISSRYPEPNGGAEMHYMLRVTGYGIAMHLGYVPNYPASHGCIRLENGFAQKMYYWANIGTPVVIIGSPPVRVDRPISRNAPKVARRSRNRSFSGNDPLKMLSTIPGKRETVAKKNSNSSSRKREREVAKRQKIEEPMTPLAMLKS